MKRLIYPEKPSSARAIMEALGEDFQARGGYYESSTSIVFMPHPGHSVTDKFPNEIDPRFNDWNDLSLIPFLPDHIPLKPIDGASRALQTIKGLLARQDVSEVICATDAAREGEHIFRTVLRFVSGNGKSATVKIPGKTIKRLWASDYTKAGILKAFSSLRSDEQMRGLAEAGKCRSDADYLIGMNFTRLCRKRVGRVQTPTLKILADRQLENQNFQPQSYYELAATAEKAGKAFGLTWTPPERLFDRAAIEPHFQQIAQAKEGQVKAVDRKENTVKPPLCFDLNTLQQECNKRWKTPAKRTLEIVQKLYDPPLSCVTYPRTDSSHLSTDLFREIEGHFQAIQVRYPAFAGRVLELVANHKQAGTMPAVVNDKEVSDHHAIIPTSNPAPADLTEEDARVYDLICRRFLSAFSEPARYDEIKASVDVAGLVMATETGVTPKARGWHEIEPEKAKKAVELPALAPGETVAIKRVDVATKQTQAPALYTEATLLAKLKALGLGTPATWAPLIEKICDPKAGLCRRDSKSVFEVLPNGFALLDAVLKIAPAVADPETTAVWEKRLAAIEKGKESPDSFLAEIRAEIRKRIDAGKPLAGAIEYRKEGPKGIASCPVCKKGEVVDRGQFYGCTTWRKDGGAENCGFSLSKKAFGGTITEAAAKGLVTKGRTPRVLKLTSKAGKPYEAYLVGKVEGGRFVLALEFADKKPITKK